MAATPEFKVSDYFTYRERKELEISNQKCFNHHTLYVGYNVANAFCSAIKVTTWVGAGFHKMFYHCILYNSGKCTSGMSIHYILGGVRGIFPVKMRSIVQ